MVEIYLDSGSLGDFAKWADHPQIAGFTTNPSLMRKSGVTNYRDFCGAVLELVKGKPVSFEVLTDDLEEMVAQAKRISAIAHNIIVKVPVINTKGALTYSVVERLEPWVRVNLTAVFQLYQVNKFIFRQPKIVSVFAGRIADTGIEPGGVVRAVAYVMPKSKILWASAREVYNIWQAQAAGAQIITLSPQLFERYLKCDGKNLREYSLETVKEFYRDSEGLSI